MKWSNVYGHQLQTRSLILLTCLMWVYVLVLSLSGRSFTGQICFISSDLPPQIKFGSHDKLKNRWKWEWTPNIHSLHFRKNYKWWFSIEGGIYV